MNDQLGLCERIGLSVLIIENTKQMGGERHPGIQCRVSPNHTPRSRDLADPRGCSGDLATYCTLLGMMVAPAPSIMLLAGLFAHLFSTRSHLVGGGWAPGNEAISGGAPCYPIYIIWRAAA